MTQSHKNTSSSKEAPLLNRRAFFERALILGATAIGSTTLLAACNKKSGAAQGTGANTPAKVNCDDLSALTPQQLATRKGLKYVDVSPKTGKNCANCKIYLKKEPCPGCTVVPGPVKANGYCTAWQANS